MKKLQKNNVERFWKKKEEEIGEKIHGRHMARFNSGYQNVSKPIWGILFYSKSAFYFQTFPHQSWFFSLTRGGQSESEDKQLSFQIRWSDVEKIYLPPKKHSFLSTLSPPDYRIFIDYKEIDKIVTLTLTMCSRENCDSFTEFYKNWKVKKI